MLVSLESLRGMALVLRSEGCEQDPTSMRWRGPDGRDFTDEQACAFWRSLRDRST